MANWNLQFLLCQNFNQNGEFGKILGLELTIQPEPELKEWFLRGNKEHSWNPGVILRQWYRDVAQTLHFFFCIVASIVYGIPLITTSPALNKKSTIRNRISYILLPFGTSIDHQTARINLGTAIRLLNSAQQRFEDIYVGLDVMRTLRSVTQFPFSPSDGDWPKWNQCIPFSTRHGNTAQECTLHNQGIIQPSAKNSSKTNSVEWGMIWNWNTTPHGSFVKMKPPTNKKRAHYVPCHFPSCCTNKLRTRITAWDRKRVTIDKRRATNIFFLNTRNFTRSRNSVRGRQTQLSRSKLTRVAWTSEKRGTSSARRLQHQTEPRRHGVQSRGECCPASPCLLPRPESRSRPSHEDDCWSQRWRARRGQKARAACERRRTWRPSSSRWTPSRTGTPPRVPSPRCASAEKRKGREKMKEYSFSTSENCVQ